MTAPSTAGRLIDYHKVHLRSETGATQLAGLNNAPATWFGKGVGLIGIEGPVTSRLFRRLAQNLHPIFPGTITFRRKENARAAFEPVLSAPKSVSVMALVMGDDRVIQAHEKAVETALTYLETLAKSRVRKGGVHGDRRTGNILGAKFQHLTSRENDPQLHHHCVVFNITFDCEEHCWKALEAREFFRHQKVITEVYRSVLCAELHAIGYRTESRGAGVEIAGVPGDVLELFSKRHLEIERLAKNRGCFSDPGKREVIARQTRKRKTRPMTLSALRDLWWAQLSIEQMRVLNGIKNSANAPALLTSQSLGEAVAWASRHLFERVTVVPMRNLVCTVLANARGCFSVREIEEEILNDGDQFIVSDNDEVTTWKALNHEREMIGFVDAGVGTQAALNARYEPAVGLSQEQTAAIKSLLTNRDHVMALVGPAGASKTTTLQGFVFGCRAAGKKVAVLAPTSNATQLLRGPFIGAMTLQRFLKDRRSQADLFRGVIILDEAGLASVQQMVDLFTIAKKESFRVVLVGDSRQHKSVEAGDAFRILESQSSLYRVTLSTIHRQKDEAYRHVVESFYTGNFEAGFESLARHGRVLEFDEDTRYGRLASDHANIIADGGTALPGIGIGHRSKRVVSSLGRAVTARSWGSAPFPAIPWSASMTRAAWRPPLALRSPRRPWLALPSPGRSPQCMPAVTF